MAKLTHSDAARQTPTGTVEIWLGPLARGSTLAERARQIDAAAARIERVAEGQSGPVAFRLGKVARRYQDQARAWRTLGAGR
jgi:hypothetical protein